MQQQTVTIYVLYSTEPERSEPLIFLNYEEAMEFANHWLSDADEDERVSLKTDVFYNDGNFRKRVSSSVHHFRFDEKPNQEADEIVAYSDVFRGGEVRKAYNMVDLLSN